MWKNKSSPLLVSMKPKPLSVNFLIFPSAISIHLSRRPFKETEIAPEMLRAESVYYGIAASLVLNVGMFTT